MPKDSTADRHAERARADLRWYYTEAPSEMGLRAASIEPQSSAPSCAPHQGPSTRALRAADRARRIRHVISALPEAVQHVLAAAHGDLPHAIADAPEIRNDREAREHAAVVVAECGAPHALSMKLRDFAAARARAKRTLAAAFAVFLEAWRASIATWRPLHTRWDDA